MSYLLPDSHPKPKRKPAERLRFGGEEQHSEREISHLCNKMARRKRYDACDELVRLKGLEPTR